MASSIAARVAAGVLVLAMTFGGCGGGTHRDLQVMSYAPQGADRQAPSRSRSSSTSRSSTRRWSASRPSRARVAIAPAIAWKGFWQDRQTLVDRADRARSRRRRATSVALAGRARARAPPGFAFAFVHQPLAVEGVWGVDADALAPDGDAAAVVQPAGASRPTPRALQARRRRRPTIALATPRRPRPADRSRSSPATHARARRVVHADVQRARRRRRQRRRSTSRTRSRCARARRSRSPSDRAAAATTSPPTRSRSTITFSTPVTLDAARKAVTSDAGDPRPRSGLPRRATAPSTRSPPISRPRPTTRSRSTGSTDTFGQKLDEPFEHDVPHRRRAAAALDGARHLRARGEREGLPGVVAQRRQVRRRVRRDPEEQARPAAHHRHELRPVGRQRRRQADRLEGARRRPRRRTTRTTTGARTSGSSTSSTSARPARGAPGAARRVPRRGQLRRGHARIRNRGWLTPRRNRVLANVTDLGVLIKVGTSSGLVWVTSLATGAPVDGAKVSVFTPAGKQVCDRHHRRRRPRQDPRQRAAEGAEADRRRPIRKRRVRLGQLPRAAADRDRREGRRPRGRRRQLGERHPDLELRRARGSRAAARRSIRGFIQSDRGLYRPGERVHFKGIVREIAAGPPPRVPAQAAPVAIEVSDSRGQVVMTTKAKLSSVRRLRVRPGRSAPRRRSATTTSRATVAGQVFREQFSVEEFRAADVRARRSSSADAAPQAGRPARVRSRREVPVRRAGRRREGRVEPAQARRTRCSSPATTSTRSRRTRAQWWWYEPRDDYGEFVVRRHRHDRRAGPPRDRGARSRDRRSTGPIDYILSANVTDATRSDDGQVGRSSPRTRPRSISACTRTSSCRRSACRSASTSSRSIPTASGSPTKAHLSFIRTRQHVRLERGRRAQLPALRRDATRSMIERDVDIAAGGSHTERIYPTEPGDYVVKAEAKDARGNAVVASRARSG